MNIYGARWKIEAGFREIKQEIGSAETQTRNPDAVTNHLNFCMAATAITWIYGAHLGARAAAAAYATATRAPNMPSPTCGARSPRTSAGEGFGIDCVGAQTDTKSPDRRGYGAGGVMENEETSVFQ